jgi:hypothetical protein
MMKGGLTRNKGNGGNTGIVSCWNNSHIANNMDSIKIWEDIIIIIIIKGMVATLELFLARITTILPIT